MKFTNYSLSLRILALFIFGLMVLPVKSYACDETGCNYTFNTYDGSRKVIMINDYPNYYQAPTYVPAPTPVVYVNPAPTPIVYSNTKNPKTATAPKKVAKAKTVSPVNASAVEAKAPADSNLAANAILGSNSFIPSGLIQWIFFAILVLLAVILVRRIYGGKEKYDAIPMKHE